MTTVAIEPRPDPIEPRPITRADYLNVAYGVRSWLLTLDHKRIAILYLVSVTLFFILGGLLAAVVRIELATPKGDLLSSDGYNVAFTLHGVVMLFFFLIPSIPATLGNFLVPLMVGAKDLAFPRLNLASWYIFMLGGLFGVYTLLTGGIDTGWTFYTPLSTKASHAQVMTGAVAALITGFSSILTGLNFVVTIHTMRAPGLTWFRLPLFIWAIYATSIVILLGTPVITIVLILVAIERF